jgi:hypothetical protein
MLNNVPHIRNTNIPTFIVLSCLSRDYPIKILFNLTSILKSIETIDFYYQQLIAKGTPTKVKNDHITEGVEKQILYHGCVLRSLVVISINP